ncbi:MAG TPA: nucleotidyltransferase [Anaerolineae bacterium]|nr:nucleotidyltransferase [Anaerolineae bacterium]
MQKQLDALREVKEFLDRHSMPHFVIGGVANAVWGRARATYDTDFKVLIGNRTIEEFVKLVGNHFELRVSHAVDFAKRTYVVPVYARNRVAVDLGLGFLPYEEQAVEKAIAVSYRGVTFAACTPEDLIIHKAISEREKDWADIEGVLIRQKGRLDQAYITHWLEQFANALARPELAQRYQALRKKTTTRRRKRKPL